MLRVAIPEAKRAQDLAINLARKKYGNNFPYAEKSQGLEEGIGGGSVGSGGDGTRQRRSRRRRRTKKPPGAGSVPRPVRPGPRPGNAQSAACRNKRHDPPLQKCDLYLSLRCGMVATGKDGSGSAVGRVTVVNWENQIVLDTFVKVAPEDVFDYRTEVTGITAELLAMTSAIRFDNVRSKVGNLIKGKILVGHGVEVDLHALGLGHPWCDVRDTATYAPYMKIVSDPLSEMLIPRSLGELMVHTFGRELYEDQPSLVREAVGCMELYKYKRDEWENELTQVMQQKEKQRQVIMKQRALSSIREDSVASSGMLNQPAVRGQLPHAGVDEGDYDDNEEEYTYTSSTLASTDPSNLSSVPASSTTSYIGDYDDDVSEASSFFTQESLSESSLFRVQQGYGNMPSHIENLSELSELDHLRPEVGVSRYESDSGTVPGSEWSQDKSGDHTSASNSLSSCSIWSPIVSSTTSRNSRPDNSQNSLLGASSQNSGTNEEWSVASPQGKARTPVITDEHLLPTNLLEDIGQNEKNDEILDLVKKTSSVMISRPQHGGEKKRSGWFSGRNRSNSESCEQPKAISPDEHLRRWKQPSRDVRRPPGF